MRNTNKIMKLRKFIATTIREYLNEQQMLKEDIKSLYHGNKSGVKLSDINAVIQQTIDSSGSVTIYTLSAPSTNVTIGLNQIGTLGTITYV